jgi:hypothetical protein
MLKTLPDKSVAIDDLLEKIVKAVDEANRGTPLPIASVEIVLKTKISTSGGLDFSIPLISKISGKFVANADHANEMHITFEPKPPEPISRMALQPDLSEAVQLIKSAIVTAGSKLPGYVFKSASVQIDFIIDETGSISFVFTLGEAASYTNSIIIHFGERDKK